MHRELRFGTLAILCLVALRMGVGWHFYREGIKKLQNQDFTSKYFLLQAKGPLAGTFHDLVPDRFGESTLDRRKVVTVWDEFYSSLEKDWSKEKAEQAKRITKSWKGKLTDYFAGLGTDLTEHLEAAAYWRESQQRADASIEFRQQELWNMENELIGRASPWMKDVQALTIGYKSELLRLSGKPADGATPPPKNWVDHAVTWTTISVGALLMLGLGTRLAALVGSGFLASVLLTQPFWVWGTDQTYSYYQFVEILALALLGVVGAGRFWGLDYFWGALRKKPWLDEPGDNDEFDS